MGVFSDIMSNSTFLGPGMQPAHSPNPTEADRQKYNKVQRRRAYFDGLRGLQGGARADWEKRYLKQITGRDPYQQDQFFKNTVFKEIFKGSTDPEKQKVWNNRHDLTPDQRDLYVARDLVNAGASAIMPLGSCIGSNKGLMTKDFIQIFQLI